MDVFITNIDIIIIIMLLTGPVAIRNKDFFLKIKEKGSEIGLVIESLVINPSICKDMTRTFAFWFKIALSHDMDQAHTMVM